MKTILTTTMGALLLVSASAAHAGCGLTVTFDNDTNKAITVLLVEAKTTGGEYTSVHKKNFTIDGGKKSTLAIETEVGCALPHHLRAKYEKNGNTLYLTKGPIVTAVDKKITMEFED